MFGSKDILAPIILVGAPRSGTKMLRELLKFHPLVIGSLYEKERIWCYGNRDKTGRAIQVSELSPKIRRYIRDHFDREFAKNPGKRIVDKNVRNSLRIEFVRRIFPEGPVIHIVRDGRDAACSIRKRWKSPLDLKYILENKAFPLNEIPFFVQRQVVFLWQRMVGLEGRVKWWGPKFDDSEELVNRHSLIEICGIQWKRCTEAAIAGLEKLEPGTFMQVKYEDVVSDPVKIMDQIRKFLDLPVSDNFLGKCSDYVNSSSVGSWRIHLTSDELALLMRHIQDTLARLDYLGEG
jgi:hypothetical protein